MIRIIDIESKQTYDIQVKKAGESNLPCPACASLHPKSAKRTCFSWNDQKKAGFCHRCDAKFVEFKPMEKKEEYILPKFNDKTDLSEAHLKWFQGRMISNEALVKAKIYSSREFMPQLEKEVSVACFPFYREGKLINIKYRGPQKTFKLHKGSEKILFNWDLGNSSNSMVIVEGEIDALSYLTCGINFVVSVPNGASSNLDYLEGCIDELDKKEIIYLAVDQDSKGIELREELARRIGQEKCKIVDFRDCKDANEYLVKYGGPELFKTLEKARDYPVSGILRVEDFDDEALDLLEHGLQPGLKIGIQEIDDLITWETNRLLILTGIPGHGKSEFMDFVICKLNLLHGWKVGYFTPENKPTKLHYSKIFEKIYGSGYSAKNISREQYKTVRDHINNNFFWVSPEKQNIHKSTYLDESYTIDVVLSKARYLVKKFGIKIFVIDPYNRMEHQLNGESETNYISKFLDKLSNFADLNRVLVCLVAHPAKLQKVNGKADIPTLYNISGSANFFNKTDYGITVYRVGGMDGLTNQVEIYVQKVKFKHLGHTGKVKSLYNPRNGRYEAETVDGVNGWDNSNWLQPDNDQNYMPTASGEVPF